MLVRPVVFALQVDALVVAVRQHLGGEVEAVEIAPVSRNIDVDHGYIRLRPIMGKLREFRAHPLKRLERQPLRLKRIVEQTFQIARDALVRRERRRHQDRNSIDQLPPLLVRACLVELQELRIDSFRERWATAVMGASSSATLALDCNRCISGLRRRPSFICGAASNHKLASPKTPSYMTGNRDGPALNRAWARSHM